eukprot:XP_011663470.1 PREDICTED: uncharacterized protein K02A2.6-like [Strongylocentrotus purpuratus]
MSMPILPPFDPHGDSASLSQRWEQYIKRFEGAMVGFNIIGPKRKRALLLHYGGEQLQNVFDTLPDTGTDNDYERKGRARPNQKSSQCGNCGYGYPHTGDCPAKGKRCNTCNKMNHFASVCRNGKPVKSVSDDNATSLPSADTSQNPVDTIHEYMFAVSNTKPPTHVGITIDGIRCSMIIDSGCSRNIIDEPTYKKLNVSLKKSSIRLFPYGSKTPLSVLGVFTGSLESQRKTTAAEIYVVKGSYGCLLGRSTAEDLNLIIINDTANAVNAENDYTSAYPNLWSGVGKLKDKKVKLHIDTSVPPVAQRFRSTPFHLRKQIEKQLAELQDADIIEDATGPTPWVSPTVAVPKPNDPQNVRICVDMRAANKAVIRERHPTPTMDEIITELNGSKVFSKLDLKSGYHQLELEPESRYITTFATHVGLKRYKRLNFGISSASEVFQNAIRQTLEGIPGVLNVSDDILVHAPDEASHNERLNTLFQRLQEQGLTLNTQKCQFNKTTISFFGLVFSAEGASPDPDKVDAIHQAARPQNAQEVRSLLGMASYSSRFIPNLATITAPLRSLMTKGVKFEWNQEHEAALKALKDSISKSAVSSYFDTAKRTILYVDASPVGLGAMLTQEGSTIIYASRSLTPTEQRYSQIEREALGIAWGVHRLHTYLFGRNFTVVTDHKPLIPIFGKPKIVPSARIANWMLKLQHYDMDVIHAPGKTNPADYISRHPCSDSASTPMPDVEAYINFVAHHAAPKTASLDDIRSETARDSALQATIEAYRSGKWENLKGSHRAMWNVRNEIAVTEDDIVLRDKRIVIPEALHKRIIDIAHESHPGIVRTKALLRSKVWFESLDSKVESLVKDCPVCQTVRDIRTPLEPLKMSQMPPGPWQNLSIDFCGPLPTGEYLMVLIDEFSRYPVVEVVGSVSARAVIPVLDKVLSVFGFPKVLKSDNGSPFNSSSFADYASHCGFQHRRITPHWPRANAQAEAFNKPLITAVRAAHLEGKNWKQQLYIYLRQYRATPHSSTRVSPFRLMFNREPVTRLPEVDVAHDNTSSMVNDEIAASHSKAIANDHVAKAKQKSYADKRLHTVKCDFKVGDKVIVRNDARGDKFTPPYNPTPLVIIKRKGNMITAKCQSTSWCVTRNVSFFKRSPSQSQLILNRRTSQNKVTKTQKLWSQTAPEGHQPI